MKIEMYYGYYQDNLKLWDTEWVSIPWSTPDDQVEKAACEAFDKAMQDAEVDIAFWHVYCTNDSDNDHVRDQVRGATGWKDVDELMDRAEPFVNDPGIDAEFEDLQELFRVNGGRGVELADRIDVLRAAIAMRESD